MKENIQLYILSRDRPNFLKKAIDSALNQNPSPINFEIIVSDNSESDNISKLIARYYTAKELKYIRRDPPISAIEHFKIIVSELNSKYSVLFHDDDVLCSDYMRTMSLLIQEDDIAAIGCNAIILKNNMLSSKKEHKFSSLKKFDNEREFLEQYLPGRGGIAPFPGYMYVTKYLQQSFSNFSVKGKHVDVEILTSLLNYGEIAWCEEPLMYYRIHDSNDSVVENIPDRLQLINYMKDKGVDKHSTEFIIFRVSFWYRWIKQQGAFLSNITRWRYRTVILSIFSKTVNIFGTLYFWKTLLYRYMK